jgi:hypothetical protein
MKTIALSFLALFALTIVAATIDSASAWGEVEPELSKAIAKANAASN